ncbi:hypothetical protein BT63DRAFT_424351 [Microthyrium microscopicum]|uniref:Uncharacterized protein n=1 Tax=Microthyrium microscopicum TaxID=703497 RepID=A0A6A6UG27_9PEZI|nr:hypothetical protein BT63DRAFT_424351 [Microthyrium microscopicum]
MALPREQENTDISEPLASLPLRNDENEEIFEERNAIPQERKRKRPKLYSRRVRNTLTLLFGVCWIVPAVCLMYLDISGYVVGAAIGCRSCRINPNLANASRNEQAQDKRNHNILGALQLLAKLLEAWFIFAAGSLAYNYAIRLAKKGVLPVSMLTVHAEFLNLPYMRNLMGRTIGVMKEGSSETRSHHSRENSQIFESSAAHDLVPQHIGPGSSASSINRLTPLQARRNRLQLYVFVFCMVFLCLLANLMNPALAILILPQLQFKTINLQQTSIFQQLFSSSSPNYEAGDFRPLPGCSAAQIAGGLYNCTSLVYGTSLDGLLSSGSSSYWQVQARHANYLPAVSQEMNISFSFNTSTSAAGSSLIWTPSRQVLRNLSSDLQNYKDVIASASTDKHFHYNATRAYPDSSLFAQSTQAKLLRYGPVYGTSSACHLFNVIRIPDGQNREIRCYPTLGRSYTKCIQSGSGYPQNSNWPGSSANLTLEAYIAATAGVLKLANTTISIYSTPKARYFQQDENGNSCASSSPPSCGNWDDIFSKGQPNFDIGDGNDASARAQNQLTFEYGLTAANDGNNTMVWCDTHLWLGFSNYILDLNPLYSTLNLVEIDVPTETLSGDTSIPLHPDWMLAAWSANREDSRATGDIVGLNHPSASQVITGLNTFANPPFNDTLAFAPLHIYSVAQGLSFVPFSSIDDPAASNNKGGVVLFSSASVQLWQYSASAATSIIALVVITLGILVVLLRTIFYLERSRTPTELIIDALRSHRAIPPTVAAQIDQKSGEPLRVNWTPRPDKKQMSPDMKVRPGHRRTSSSFMFHYPSDEPSPGIEQPGQQGDESSQEDVHGARAGARPLALLPSPMEEV